MIAALRGILAALALACGICTPALAQDVAGDDRAVFEAAAEAMRLRDHATAFDLFEVLAEKDLPEAQFIIAGLLWEGRGRTQNFRDALYWAWLAKLGTSVAVDALTLGITGDQESLLAAKRALEENAQTGRAADAIIARIVPSVSVEQQAEIVARIATRLEAQLAEGRRDAVMKYAILKSEIMAEPDLETAYVWFSIGRALGIIGAQEKLDAVADLMEDEMLLAAQTKAAEVFATSAFGNAGANRSVQP
jgi:TPR repeat protein